MAVEKFTTMIGVTMKSVVGREGGDELIFTSEDDERFIFQHDQDCCERVEIVDIDGSLRDLVGAPLTMAEETSSAGAPEPPDAESFTWTFYRFGSKKGYVTVRWLGTSSGYYSERVSFYDESRSSWDDE